MLFVYLPTCVYLNLSITLHADPLLEWAAFFGQAGHETGSFCYTTETNPQSNYCNSNFPDYPCVLNQSYKGRGALQMSWNYNYGPFSQVWYGDKNILLQNPDLVASDGVAGFGSALWFWSTVWTNHYGITSHIALAEPLPAGGYGAVTRVINGMECGPDAESDPRQISRVAKFKRAAAILGTTGDKVTQNLWCTVLNP